MRRECDAFADLPRKLESLATHLYSDLDDRESDVLRKWQSDQANPSAYARRLSGEGPLKEPAKLAQNLVESAEGGPLVSRRRWSRANTLES